MDMTHRYQDVDGNPCSIIMMVKRGPEWAANRIQAGEHAEGIIQRIHEATKEYRMNLISILHTTDYGLISHEIRCKSEFVSRIETILQEGIIPKITTGEIMKMRAKMKVTKVVKHSDTCEELEFAAVCKSDGPFPPDGTDENNSFAKWTPTASLKMSITNPALIGNFEQGQEFYLDFTKAE